MNSNVSGFIYLFISIRYTPKSDMVHSCFQYKKLFFRGIFCQHLSLLMLRCHWNVFTNPFFGIFLEGRDCTVALDIIRQKIPKSTCSIEEAAPGE